MTEIIDFLKKYTDGKQNTEKVEISVLQLNRVIKTLEQQPCEDAIDRAEAMTEIMMFAGNVKPDEEDIYIKVSDAVQLLRELPPVTPKPKTGRWVHGEYCSECGCDVPAYISDWKWQKDMDAKYCPNCGAKMEKKEKNNG